MLLFFRLLVVRESTLVRLPSLSPKLLSSCARAHTIIRYVTDLHFTGQRTRTLLFRFIVLIFHGLDNRAYCRIRLFVEEDDSSFFLIRSRESFRCRSISQPDYVDTWGDAASRRDFPRESFVKLSVICDYRQPAHDYSPLLSLSPRGSESVQHPATARTTYREKSLRANFRL